MTRDCQSYRVLHRPFARHRLLVCLWTCSISFYISNPFAARPRVMLWHVRSLGKTDAVPMSAL